MASSSSAAGETAAAYQDRQPNQEAAALWHKATIPAPSIPAAHPVGARERPWVSTVANAVGVVTIINK